jgi:cobalt-zinc-cadmium efflux system membrane fusion protein
MKKTNYYLMLILISSQLMLACSQTHKNQHDVKSIKQVEITNPQKESDLTTIKLNPEAQARLGIVVTEVKQESLSRSLTQHGEIISRPGFAATITAPSTGKISILNKNSMKAGSQLTKGQKAFSLVVLPSDSTGLGVKQDVEVKTKQVELVQARVSRLETLLESNVTSKRSVEEARVELANAQAALNSALARQRYLSGNAKTGDLGYLSSINITAPFTGMIQQVYVTDGQLINAGSALFELTSLDPVWVRVPVYAGDLGDVSASGEATVQTMGQKDGGVVRTAKYVPGPLVTNAQAVSTDLYYELSNSDNAFKLGQKVNVSLALQGNNEDKLTIPSSTIVYDIYGGTWVYEQIEENTFTRQRVEVERVEAAYAVISRGIKPGMKIVQTGTAELFGTEFGVGK